MGALGRCGGGAVDLCLHAGIPTENVLKWGEFALERPKMKRNVDVTQQIWPRLRKVDCPSEPF